MTKREQRQLETELRAARQLGGFQLEKLQRQKKTIARLERRVEKLESRLKLADLAGAEA